MCFVTLLLYSNNINLGNVTFDDRVFVQQEEVKRNSCKEEETFSPGGENEKGRKKEDI